jgi:lipoate-protein ligase B
VGRKYEPGAEIREGAQLGVWTPRGKFAAVGIKIKQGVVQHGLSINGWRTPGSFVGLRPCGLDLPVDYLLSSAESGALSGSDEFDNLGQEIIAAAQARLTKFKFAGYS